MIPSLSSWILIGRGPEMEGKQAINSTMAA